MIKPRKSNKSKICIDPTFKQRLKIEKEKGGFSSLAELTKKLMDNDAIDFDKTKKKYGKIYFK